MKKRGLFIVFIFFLIFMVSGCRTEFDNNNTKLVNMSFNKPIGYKDSRYPIGNYDDKHEYEMRVYEFNNYSIEITWRQKDTFKKYTKDSDVKYKKKTINGTKYKYSEDDNSINYLVDYMDDLYIFKFTGEKSDENKAVFDELLKSVKYRE